MTTSTKLKKALEEIADDGDQIVRCRGCGAWVIREPPVCSGCSRSLREQDTLSTSSTSRTAEKEPVSVLIPDKPVN